MGGTITVRDGDTLSDIAKRNGMNVLDVIAQNPQFRDPNYIRPGDTVYISGVEASASARSEAGNRMMAYANQVGLPGDKSLGGADTYLQRRADVENQWYDLGVRYTIEGLSPRFLIPEVDPKEALDRTAPEVRTVLEEAGMVGLAPEKLTFQQRLGQRAPTAIESGLAPEKLSLRQRISQVQPAQRYTRPTPAPLSAEKLARQELLREREVYDQPELSPQEIEQALQSGGPDAEYARASALYQVFNLMRTLQWQQPFFKGRLDQEWQKYINGEQSFFTQVSAGSYGEEDIVYDQRGAVVPVPTQQGDIIELPGPDYFQQEGYIEDQVGVTFFEKMTREERAAALSAREAARQPISTPELLGYKAVDERRRVQREINAQIDSQITQTLVQAINTEYAEQDAEEQRRTDQPARWLERLGTVFDNRDGQLTPERIAGAQITGISLMSDAQWKGGNPWEYAGGFYSPDVAASSPLGDLFTHQNVTLADVVSPSAANAVIITPRTPEMRQFFDQVFGKPEGFSTVEEFWRALGYYYNPRGRDPMTGQYTGAWEIEKNTQKPLSAQGTVGGSYYVGPQTYPYTPYNYPVYGRYPGAGGYGGRYQSVLWRISA